jgi:sodium/pantothenate symporter
MPFLLLTYYVIPYQIGTGQILPDGSVNWNTGEALITLTVFMLHVPLALMAMKVIWDRYDPRSNRNQKILRRALFTKAGTEPHYQPAKVDRNSKS